MIGDSPLLRAHLPRELVEHQQRKAEITWKRWGRLAMGFGATVEASLCTLGVGLTFGWLTVGSAGAACPGQPGSHVSTERLWQIIPPAIGVGILQGTLCRRVTGALGVDESGRESAVAIYLPFKVAPRQAFLSLFAVALGWVGLAFPVFLAVRNDSYVCKTESKLPGFNPLPLTPTWSYAIVAVWAVVLILGMWGWVNAPRHGPPEMRSAPGTAAPPKLPKVWQDTVFAWCNFGALALFGYGTGLPTLCAVNSLVVEADTTTWQTHIGYPDVGCAGTFQGPDGCEGLEACYNPTSQLFQGKNSGSPYWLWVAGWISFLVLVLVNTCLHIARVYRRAWAELAYSTEVLEQSAAFNQLPSPANTTPVVWANGDQARIERQRARRAENMGLTRQRSWSQPQQAHPRANAGPASSPPSPPGSLLVTAPTVAERRRQQSSTTRTELLPDDQRLLMDITEQLAGAGDRAGMRMLKALLVLFCMLVLLSGSSILCFMLCGDHIYEIDWRISVGVALGAVLCVAALAVGAAHGSGSGLVTTHPSDGSLRGGTGRAPEGAINSMTMPAYRGGYYLFVCDRPTTLLLTIVGVAALGCVAVALLGVVAHLQPERIVFQDSLKINPFVQGDLHWLLLGSCSVAAVFALFLDTAQRRDESAAIDAAIAAMPLHKAVALLSSGRQGGGKSVASLASLSFFVTVSMVCCVGLCLAIASLSISLFVTVTVVLAVCNGTIYALGTGRTTYPSRTYTAGSMAIIAAAASALLWPAAYNLGTNVPPLWRCPDGVSTDSITGPPWSCIDLSVPKTSVFNVVAQAAIALLVLFLCAIACLAGTRGGSKPWGLGRGVYPPTVLPIFAQPLYFGQMLRIAFFCAGFNVLGEFINLRNCQHDVVELWEWRDCGLGHDIAIDLLAGTYTVGFFVTFFSFFHVVLRGVLQKRVLPVRSPLNPRHTGYT
jgi:hypothetical protein